MRISPIIKIIFLFLFSRVLFLIVFVITTSVQDVLPEKNLYWNYSANKVLNFLGCWDSGWYLYIANVGYVNTPLNQGQTNYGFFPMYPLLLKIFSFLTGDTYSAGILVSNLATILAAFLLFALCQHLYNNLRISYLAVFVLFFFPGSYLLSGVFSEACFLFFSLACFYYFEKGEYLWSSLFGCAATLTRPFGVLLIVPLLIRYFERRGLGGNKGMIYLFLIPLGLIMFFTYCYFTTGDFFLYIHAKQIGWQTQSDNPINVLINGIRHPKDIYFYVNTWYCIGIIALLAFAYKYIPFSYWIWSFLLIIAPLSNGDVNLICMPRYILVAFPMFILLARYASYSIIGKIAMLLLVLINFILCSFYVLGYQFAA